MKKILIVFIAALMLIASPIKAHAGIYSYNDTTPLRAQCYSNPTSAMVNGFIYWKSSVSGGNENYHITWNGNEGLSGNGDTVTKSYNYAGTKNASITVISGNQTVSRNCNSVEIYNYNTNTPTYIPAYDHNHYNNNYNNNNYNNYNNNYSNTTGNYTNIYNSPLYISCSANTTFALVGNTVTWQSYASGGNGSYNYSWSGTDYLRGYDKSLSIYYNTPGSKSASITVTSAGQSITQICPNTVAVGIPNYAIYNHNQNYNQNYTQPQTITENIIVKKTIVKSEKAPEIVVKSPEKPVVVASNTNLVASTIMSNVHWGFVSIMVIIILLITIIFLLLSNKKKQ